MKKLAFGFIFFGVLALNLSFPIAELGSCESVSECKAYCDLPQNYEACTKFGVRHGLVSPGESSVTEVKAQALKAAKQKFGCSSLAACKNFCDREENWQACASLPQPEVTSEDEAMFEKYRPLIQEYLGCDSMVSCMAYCINPLHMGRCMELGKKMGFGGEDIHEWCPKQGQNCVIEGDTCTCTSTSEITDQFSQEEAPEVWCPKASGDGYQCAWDGANCNCYNPGECEKWTGCHFTGTTCECTAYEEITYPQEGINAESAPPPDTSTPPPTESVQGISLTRSLLEIIVEFLKSLI